ncbi:hypothetical protein QAD02_009036 [Eretmocerus hayati]|uniref:Uncharacterized protein n=1 Tax=Eretmocerus hayati TaxID=131215 RepID=A0ACC2N835_9HYME|nr:hypothetical protein QAD02_009036 [Eretmocerus hayati]
MSQKLSTDEIVISGISGRFPESDNVEQLRQNLHNKFDMITDDERRWTVEHPDIPKRTGKISNLEKFDALFFGVPLKSVSVMDPMCRLLMEHSYEAILDAGLNPRQLYGRKYGVFIAACVSETEVCLVGDRYRDDMHGAIGFSRAYYPNRISYSFGFTGPSYTVDTACSSSLTALENAYRAINDGLCDGAIVGGVNLCLLPQMNLWFMKLGVLSVDGQCKAFDESANGYARSEAISTILLQKAKDAKRVYATIVNARINCDGFKEQGISYPSSTMQSELLKECYSECDLSPSQIKFVEAHGTGTHVGDPIEVKSIDEVLGKNREKSDPLLIGTVKSNLGHCEGASGMVSIIKVLLGMNNDVIYPNLHLKNIRKDLEPLIEGRMKVVTELTPWDKGYVGVNSFGFSGSNGHVILKSFDKRKINGGSPSDDLPRLVTISGRTEEAVQTFFADLENNEIDVEYIRLLHDIHSQDITDHLFRGFILLDRNKKTSNNQTREIKPFDGNQKPIWFVFSGMGSQWSGMGNALLRISSFANTVQKCDEILRPVGVDIYQVLTSEDESTFENILNSFVGITVIQIGLVDILYSLNIKPDHIIGHSLGENGCAYADGSLNLEQAVMAAYYRGLVSIDTEVIHGSMAAIGLGYNDLKDLCPPDIFVACHNSSTSSTISGPTISVDAFVRQLEEKHIFAKKVQTGNIAYHSRYIEDMGPKYLNLMKKVIPNPLPRSKIWPSTSVPKDEWNSTLAQFSSAEYFTNNLCNPVLFEEVLHLIPKDAITIEIAPHGLLQAILRRSLDPQVSKLSLTMRDHEDNVKFLLESIGKMYNLGVQPDLAKFYPEIEYPVSRGTRTISHLVKWEHSVDWEVHTYDTNQKNTAGERFGEISLADSEYSSLADHVIDGRNLFPATGYLKLVWETFSIMQDKYFVTTPILFKDVRFMRATIIPENGKIVFRININIGSGSFEVAEGKTTVVTGFVFDSSHPEAEILEVDDYDDEEEPEILLASDIYKKFRLCGYDHKGTFQCLKSATLSGLRGHIKWHNNWVSFLDNMLQMSILRRDIHGLHIPSGIEKLFIDPNAHLESVKSSDHDAEYTVYVDGLNDTITSGGIQVQGVQVASMNRKKIKTQPLLEEHKFVPLFDEDEMDISDIVRVASQIVYENLLEIQIKCVELIDEAQQISASDLMSSMFAKAFDDIPAVQADITIISTNADYKDNPLTSNFSVIHSKEIDAISNISIAAGYGLLEDDQESRLILLVSKIKPGGFLLTHEKRDLGDLRVLAKEKKLDIIMKKKYNGENIILLRKQRNLCKNIFIMYVTNDKFDWVDEMRQVMKEVLDDRNPEDFRVLVIGEGDFDNGLMGLITCLRKEPGGNVLRGILIQDTAAKKFSLEDPFYAEHLQKDLALSVLRRDRTWGTYRHFLMPQMRSKEVNRIVADQTIRGDVSTLCWIEKPILDCSKSTGLARVVYSSLNFRDIMLATGKLGREFLDRNGVLQEYELGLEYSGYTCKGERVMGYVSTTSLTNLLIPDPVATIPIPDHWTLEDAATVFSAYATAYYALYMRGGMKRGEKILIHSGSGAVGQAAITLALHEGCDVFTTVGTPAKRKFILDHFPKIKDDHISSSRNIKFKQMIIKQTNGQGVDIVLNSLAEEKLLASVACLTYRGRFLEIGKYDLTANNRLGMKIFLKDVSFHGVMLDYFISESNENKSIICRYISEGIRNGAVKPIKRTVFSKDDIEAAFRFMASGEHIGKVILKMQDEENAPLKTIEAIPRYHCIEKRSYIIIGGLGGFGLELADWLIQRGARNLVLSSRSKIQTGYQQLKLKKWRENGVRVVAVTEKDASKLEDCKYIIKMAIQLAAVDGIFNLAAVLRDATLENQTSQWFEEVFRSKALTTKNLDSLSRTMCPQLKNFVIFSSCACGKGSEGQSNYGMSNSVVERICERRASEGLPALAIQWGLIGDVGLISELPHLVKQSNLRGYAVQRISSCLEELDKMMKQNKTIVCCMILSEKKSDISSSVSVIETVLNIMDMKDLTGVNLNTPLSQLGMDSMMAVEIKQTLERVHGIFMNVQDLRNLNFKELQKMSGVDSSSNATQEKNSDQTLSQHNDRGESYLLSRLKDLIIGAENPEIGVTSKFFALNKLHGREVFFIPGVEGFASAFDLLVPKLKVAAICLQLGVDSANIRIEDMAYQFLQHVHERSTSTNKFVIVAYSFGSLISVELVRSLEKMGLQGKLIMIDGAPEYIKRMSTTIPKDHLDDPQNQILLSMSILLSPEKHEEFASALKGCKTWDAKVKTYFDIAPGPKFGVSIESQRDLFKAFYTRHKATLDYDISSIEKITTPITLIKPTIKIVQLDQEDYGLSQVTSGPIRIIYAKGNHRTMLEDDKIADVINDIAAKTLA